MNAPEIKRGPGRPKGAKNKPKPGMWVANAASALREANGPAPAPPDPPAAPRAVQALPVEQPKKPLPPMPRVVSDFISEIPYKVAKGASEEFILNRGLPQDRKTTLGEPDPKTLEALHEAFSTWIKELELSASPTAQLILVNIAAVGFVTMQAGIKRGVITAQIRADERKAVADKKKAEAPPP